MVYVAVLLVKKSKNYPEGIKYNLVLISGEKRVIGYDYNPAEGHHKHNLKGDKLVKENYKFKNINDIIVKFRKDVKEYEEGM